MLQDRLKDQVFKRVTDSILSTENEYESESMVGNLVDYKSYHQKGERRRESQEKEHLLVRSHSIMPPHWSNSFKIEDPTLGIISTTLLFLYLILINTTSFIQETTYEVYIGIGVVLLYVLDCFQNGVIDYLKNKMTKQEFLQYADELKKLDIKIQYKVQAYHVKNSTSYNRRTKEYERSTRRIYTFKEEIQLPLSKIEDATEDSSALFADDKLLRVHNIMTYSYGNEESQKALDDLRKQAELKASRKDNKYEAEETVQYPEIKTHIIIYNPSQKGDSLLRPLIYALYCLLGLNLVYRIFLNKRLSLIKHCVHKKIYSTQQDCLPLYDQVGTILLQQQQNQEIVNHLIEENNALHNQNNDLLNQQQEVENQSSAQEQIQQ